jgi:hypothetical protein
MLLFVAAYEANVRTRSRPTQMKDTCIALRERFTLREFVQARMPDNWARYIRHSSELLIKPGQHRARIGDVLAQTIMSWSSNASAEARSEYDVIVKQLAILLPRYEVVADDPNHKSVVLERRHWADAIFDIENSAIRHGDQRWTNVELRCATAGSTKTSPAQPIRKGGARPIDDHKHIAKFQRQRAASPKLTIRAFVLKHDKDIVGASVEAKVRRIQRKMGPLD